MNLDGEQKKWIVFVVTLMVIVALCVWGLTVVHAKNTPQAQQTWWQNQ